MLSLCDNDISLGASLASLEMRQVIFGLIGCGGISRRHIKAYGNLKNRIKVSAVCDAVPERAIHAMQALGAETYFTEYDRLLRRDDIEAVDICLPHDLHSIVAIAAAERGKHVLCEKPIARTLDEADAMIRAAQRMGVVLMIGENYRFLPEVARAKELISNGVIGDIFLAKADCIGFPGDLAPSGWKFDASRVGGGVVIDSGIHYVDTMRWLVGEVSSVTAFLNRLIRKEISGEDTGCLLFKHAGGAISVLTLTWAARRPMDEHLFKLYGSMGTIVNAEAGVLVLAGDKPDEISKIEVEPRDSFSAEIEHIADCIVEGRHPLVDGPEARRDLELVLAAYTSAKTGETVNV